MNTTALEKLAVSMINLLPSLGAVVLFSRVADWRVVLVGTFLLYQLIIAATPIKAQYWNEAHEYTVGGKLFHEESCCFCLSL